MVFATQKSIALKQNRFANRARPIRPTSIRIRDVSFTLQLYAMKIPPCMRSFGLVRILAGHTHLPNYYQAVYA
jgi:hypothetical protein